MRFRKKVYGSYKRITCPFCDRNATQKNEQGLDVCHLHTKQVFQEIKCLCGSWLELRTGKFGPYFNCIKCGNMNYDKAMTIKETTDKRFEKEIEANKPLAERNQIKVNESKLNYKSEKKSFGKKNNYSNKPKEVIITSNDVEYFD